MQPIWLPKWSLRSLLVLNLLVGSCPQSICAVLPADVEKALRANKDIGLSRQFSLTVNDAEGVVRIATYRESEATEQDIKIDAVLMAKEVMDTAPTIARVVIDFYRTPRQLTYREIIVAKTDIAAFAGGQVTKQELMASLVAESKTDPEVAAAERKKEEAKQLNATKAKETYNQAVAKGIDPETEWTTYKAPGITFEYPKVWKLDKELEGETLARFKSSLTTYNGATIELKLYRDPKKTPVIDEAREHVQHHMRYRDYQTIARSKVIRFGVANAFTGVDENFSHTQEGKTYLDRHIYFGWPGYVYKVRVSGSKADYAHASRVFAHLLSSMKVDRSAGAAAVSKN